MRGGSRLDKTQTSDETTDTTTDETTSHSAMTPKNGGQAAGYSHLTDKTSSHFTRLSVEELLAGHPKDDNQVAGYKPAKYAGQVIGFSHSTDETPSHSTRSPIDGNQVAGL